MSLPSGLELLSVSLYALIAYPNKSILPLEAAAKYLVLSGAASATADEMAEADAEVFELLLRAEAAVAGAVDGAASAAPAATSSPSPCSLRPPQSRASRFRLRVHRVRSNVESVAVFVAARSETSKCETSPAASSSA